MRWNHPRRLHLWARYEYAFVKVVTVLSTQCATGNVTLGDILEILPFQDPIVVLELDGETLWAALEAALSTWPAQEG